MGAIVGWTVLLCIPLTFVAAYFLKCLDYMLIVATAIVSIWIFGRDLSDDGFKWIVLEFVTLFVFWTVAKQYRKQ